MAWYDYVPGGNMVNSYLHPEEGYKEAAKKMEEAWRQAQGFQEPFRQAGLDQQGRLVGAEDRLLDPSSLLAEWMSKYQESPFAKASFEKAKSSGMDAASQMGLMGSSAAVNNIQQSSSDIMNADRQQFLNDLMQKYLAGIGIGQNIYNVGAGMAGEMGRQRIGVGEELGKAAFGEKNAPGDYLKQLMAQGAKAAAQAYAGGGMGG